MYILLKRLYTPDYKIPYYTIHESEDLNKIIERLKQQVIAGCPVGDLKIVQDEKFEFKCDVKFENESEAD